MTTLLPSAPSHRSVGIIGIIVASLVLLGPPEADAQSWRRTARFATPVADGPVRTFLDTLTQVVERKDGHVRRSPDHEERLSISALREQLIEKHGTDIMGANRLLISYRFEIGSWSRLERDIVGFYFLFRPNASEADIPILYLDAQQEWVQDVMRQKGTSPSTNESALVPFRRYLKFGHVAQLDAAQIVRIGNEPVREGFAVKKESLFEQILWLTTTV